MVLFEVVNCRRKVCRVYAIGPSSQKCHLIDFLNELEANYDADRDSLYALFDFTVDKGFELIKNKSALLRDGVFRVREGNLRVFWFYDEGKIIVCTHGIIKKKQKADKEDVKYAIQLRKKYFSLNRSEIPMILYEEYPHEKGNI